MKTKLTSSLLNSLLLLSLLTAAASLNLERNITLKGNAAGDRLGNSMSSGDIDYDGYDDIVIGTANKNVVYVIYGGSNTSLDSIDLSSTPLNPSTTGFTIRGHALFDFSGSSLNIAGDINHDGYNDIVIGSVPSNAVYVIYGGPRSMMSNIDLSTMTLDPASIGFVIQGNGSFGGSVSTADVNNDDYDDIIIGARTQGGTRGAVYVIYGRPTSSMLNFDISLTPELLYTVGFSILGESKGDFIGFSVSGGDVNGDGNDDIIIGAPFRNSSTEAVYVVYGGHNLMDMNLSSLVSSTEGFKIIGEPGSSIGKSISTADIDRDGLADIIIGADNRVFVVYGQFFQTDILLSSQALDPATTGLKIEGSGAYDLFGSTVSSAGNIKNDGYDGIIIGAPGRNNGKGAAYVIYGGIRSNLTNIDFSASVSPSQAFSVDGSYSSYFGTSVCSGDINNDGVPELIIGAPVENDSQGAVHVLFYEKPQCPVNCKTCYYSVCLECSSGFALENSVCVACPANCNGCRNSSVCANCTLPYVSYQGQCVRYCPANTTLSNGTCLGGCSSNCQVCDNSTSTCQLCSYPYLLSQGQCVSSCPSKTTAVHGICLDCPSHCEDCLSSSFCSVCSYPYVLSQGHCVANCPPRTVALNGTCQNCPSHCANCTDPSSCQACSYPFVLYQGQCVRYCPANTTLSNGTCLGGCSSNCQVCDNSTSTCQLCSYPYLLSHGQCVSSCPSKTTAVHGICFDCPSHCEDCLSSSFCSVCSYPYVLSQGQCVANCPPRTVALNGTCQNCPSHCVNCTDPSSCQVCSYPFLLYQGQCVRYCPANTTASNGTCVGSGGCPNNCEVCSDSSSCQVCSYPYFLYQGQCILDCPPTTFRVNETCESCPINCDTCSDSSYCQVCSYPLFLYEGQCVSYCPARTVAVNGTCENCPDYCEVCSSPTSCQVCASPYSWNQGGQQIVTNSSPNKLTSQAGEIKSDVKSAARIFAGTSLVWAFWFLLSLLL